MTDYGYGTGCRHCGARPFSEGPHHEKDCPRRDGSVRPGSRLAHSVSCGLCGARPFIAGPHHRKDCRRLESDFRRV
jgi:hypothetical protein